MTAKPVKHKGYFLMFQKKDFNAFIDSLMEVDGRKLKSGTIKDLRKAIGLKSEKEK